MTHERGEPFRTHMEKNSKGVHISEIYNTETQDNLIRGESFCKVNLSACYLTLSTLRQLPHIVR